MEENREKKLVAALESISINLAKLVGIIEREEFYVRGDIHAMTEDA